MSADDVYWARLIHHVDMAHADLTPERRVVNIGVVRVPAGSSNAAKTGGAR